MEGPLFCVIKRTTVGREREGGITFAFRKALLHITILYSVVKTVSCARFKHFFWSTVQQGEQGWRCKWGRQSSVCDFKALFLPDVLQSCRAIF